VIGLKDVNKSFTTAAGLLPILKGINVEIGKGEFVALTGPSGSGKSTLMSIVGCLEPPTTGKVYVEGVELSSLSDNEQAELRSRAIGFVFQAFHLIQSLSLEENVEVPLFYAGVPRKDRRKRAREALARVGLSGRTTHKPYELSGGEQQRASIARALIREPGVILADEPTGNLDSKTCEQIMAILEGVRKEGKTILIVTHDQSIAARASRQIRLNDGVIASDSQQVLTCATAGSSGSAESIVPRQAEF
jgi:putative ABC transport system ATP-binding protein